LFQGDAGQVDPGADPQLAEDLAQMERHGVHAQEHLVGGLLVGQPLCDELGDRAFGVGQARPPGDGPIRRCPLAGRTSGGTLYTLDYAASANKVRLVVPV
jgi:hypothetical protein